MIKKKLTRKKLKMIMMRKLVRKCKKYKRSQGGGNKIRKFDYIITSKIKIINITFKNKNLIIYL